MRTKYSTELKLHQAKHYGMVVDSPVREVPPPLLKLRHVCRLTAGYTLRSTVLVLLIVLCTGWAFPGAVLSIMLPVVQGWHYAWMPFVWVVGVGFGITAYELWSADVIELDNRLDHWMYAHSKALGLRRPYR